MTVQTTGFVKMVLVFAIRSIAVLTVHKKNVRTTARTTESAVTGPATASLAFLARTAVHVTAQITAVVAAIALTIQRLESRVCATMVMGEWIAAPLLVVR